MCRKIHEPSEDSWIYCEICNRYFRGYECLELHKKLTAKGNSTCFNYYRCEDCGRTVNRSMSKKPYVCGTVYCKSCKDFFDQNHRCYMLPEEEMEFNEPMSIEEELAGEKTSTYIFFDFECTQEDQLHCEKGYTPNDEGKCQ